MCSGDRDAWAALSTARGRAAAGRLSCLLVVLLLAMYGRELLAQTGRRLAAVVCTVSTGGIARYLKWHAPGVEVIGVDVHGSTVFGGTAHSYSYLTPGVGLSWTPANLDLSLVDAVYKVSDEDAYLGCRTLVRAEGILAGVSTGGALLVALAEAMRRPPHQQAPASAAN